MEISLPREPLCIEGNPVWLSVRLAHGLGSLRNAMAFEQKMKWQDKATPSPFDGVAYAVSALLASVDALLSWPSH